MRFRVVSAKKLFPAKLERVAAANHGETVRDRGPAHDGQTGNEDLCSQAGTSWNIEADFCRNVRNYVKSGVVELRLQCILGGLAEHVKPSRPQRVVIGMDGTAAREAGQRLHIGRLLQIVRVVVAQEKLIFIIQMVIQAEGGLITVRVERKYASIVFELIDDKAVEQGLARANERIRTGIAIHSQDTLKGEGASLRVEKNRGLPRRRQWRRWQK